MNTHQSIVSISQNLVPADDVEQLREKFSQHLASLRITVISIADRYEALRLEWLASQAISYYEYKFKTGDDDKISEYIDGSHVVIFSGNDPHHLKKIIKKYKYKLDRSIAICVTNKMIPHHRAMLLVEGFDDVIDISKVQRDEFIARCGAMQMRAEMAYKLKAEKLETEIRLNAIADDKKLNRRHKIILTSLLSSKNNTVSYELLREKLSMTHEPISLIQMKVLVCQTRKALRPGVQIASLAWLRLPGSGYKLLINDNLENIGFANGNSVSGIS